MKFLITYLFILLAFSGSSQNNLISGHSFYKDHVFANKLSTPYNGGSFFPISEKEYDIITAINDSSKQYYDFTQKLFKEHLFELKGKDYYLTISPTFNFSRGKDFSDTSNRVLFQNTRGFIVEGDLFRNFSFSTQFYENQGRFTQYQSDYYNSLGELYASGNGQYLPQNAVIPGAGRTKYFNGDGFDYAYAIGNMTYTPNDKITLTTGNNQHFVGDGHRSLLLSDHSYGSPYFAVDWHINKVFRFTYMRSRLMNLVRKPATGSVESYYEAKGYSMNYFTYTPNEKVNISFFEGSIWNRGDSITSKHSHPMFYNPIPFLSALSLEGKDEVSSLFGINAGFQILDKHRIYGQLAMNGFDTKKIGIQLGYRGYNYFGLQDFMLQLEYNYVPVNLYQADNTRLNYNHYNMSLGHSRGNGFQEIVLRSNYEYKRFYAELSSSFYMFKDYEGINLSPVTIGLGESNPESFNVLNSALELGYRFNRKMNFSVFMTSLIRTTTQENSLNTSFFNVGIRTGLINHYRDL